MPGLYSPSAGDVLTAANAIEYWSKNVVIICTSGTRPASPRSGMTIWQTDTLTYAVYGTAWCETTPYMATVATSETTTSTSYADLATSGPSVTVTTGTKALVTEDAWVSNSGSNASYISFAVSGATTIAAADTQYIGSSIPTGGQFFAVMRGYPLTSLTAGVNTFKLRYKVSAGTGTFLNRDINVEGLPT